MKTSAWQAIAIGCLIGAVLLLATDPATSAEKPLTPVRVQRVES